MSALAHKLFDTVKESLGNAPGQIGAELKHQVSHSAHELAAALFNQNGFVMYARGGHDDHGKHGPEPAPGHDQATVHGLDEPTQQLQRGGRGGQ
jgi:hypothetical protein